MISRLDFLAGAAATTVATGGLDVWDPTSLQVRVLVASDLRGETPQVYPDGTFGFGGKRWRGSPSTVRSADGRFALVTTLDIDAYLEGVVPLESPPSWPAPALQAQAIVARTYALARRTLSRAYDVSATESDQRWGGVDAEKPATSAAIAATRGQVLHYNGALAEVFYSACCGGHTADIAAAWGSKPIPYLRGVVDPYCVQAPDYRWTRDVPLERALAAFGARTGGTITAATLEAPDERGRPRAVTFSGGASASIPIAELRRALGGDVVRSLWLRTIRVETQAAPRLVIEGSGRGHGVGLCQWGARFFASSGATAAAILALYFPGTQVAGG